MLQGTRAHSYRVLFSVAPLFPHPKGAQEKPERVPNQAKPSLITRAYPKGPSTQTGGFYPKRRIRFLIQKPETPQIWILWTLGAFCPQEFLSGLMREPTLYGGSRYFLKGAAGEELKERGVYGRALEALQTNSLRYIYLVYSTSIKSSLNKSY